MNKLHITVAPLRFYFVFLLILHGVAGRARGHGSLLVAGLFPVAGTKEVCVDTPLRLSFNGPPVLGAGQIKVFDAADDSVVRAVDVGSKTATESIGGVPEFHYYPVIVSGNDATVYLPSGSLAYGKRYYVTVDAPRLRSLGPVSRALGTRQRGDLRPRRWRLPNLEPRSWLRPMVQAISAPYRERSIRSRREIPIERRSFCARGFTRR